MATIQQLGTALKNAHAAGDVEAAQRLAAAIREMQSRPRGEDLSSFFTDQEARYGRPERQEEAGFFENVGTGFLSGLVGTGEMASLGAATLLEEDNELAARERIKAVADVLRPEGGDPDSISYLVSSGLGSLVGALAPAALAATAPVSAPVAAGIGLGGAAAIGIGAGAGEASERARAAGATEEERAAATRRGAAIGSLEILPLGRILRIPGVTELAQKIGGKTVEEGGSRIRSALTTGGVEAAQEAAAGFLQNLNERGYNAERELLDAGLIDEAIAGGGAGAILQAVVDTFTKGRAGRGTTEVVAGEPTEIGEVTAEEALPKLEEGQVQGELFARPITPTVEAGTGEALTDFNADQINSAVERLTARGIAPASITEEAVFDEILAAEQPQAAPEQLTIEDAIDQSETREIESLFQKEVDDAELAEIEAFIRAEEDVAAENERMRLDSERETEAAVARQEGREEKDAPRVAVLEDVIGQPTTGSYVNLERRFSEELARRNIASGERAMPTPREKARIKRAADAFAGMRPQEPKKPQLQEPLEVMETAPEATQLTEMEQRIPERRAEPDREPTQQSFPGMGRRKGKRTDELTEEAPAPKPITKEYLDGLGIAPKAPIRKRTEGKDLNDPDVRKQFVDFANNTKVAQQTRLNIARELEGVPEAQLELFQPRGRKGGKDAQPKPSEQRPSGAGVQDTAPTLDFGAPLPEGGRTPEAAPTPRGRGVDRTGGGTGAAPRRAAGEQLTLDLTPVDRQRLKQPLEERITGRAAVTQEVVREAEKRRAATESQQESEVRKVVPTFPEAGAKVTKDLKKTKLKRTRAAAPAPTTPKRRAPVEDNASKELNTRFEQLDSETKDIANTLSTDYSDTLGADVTTMDDRLKILSLLTNGATARDKVGNAAITYLGKVKRPMDGLYLAIFDVANQTPQYRPQANASQADRNFYGGMGQKPAQRTLDWAKANLSDKTNKWIEETLKKEVREFNRIENTDYVELFREREAKLAANEAELQSQIEAEMREDVRANLDELAKMFSKKLERSAVVGLDIPLHPFVRTVLGKGDLRGALLNLASWSPSSRVAQVAKKLAEVTNDRARLAEAKRATQGSKVKGIVYHGSPKTDITEFKSGDVTKGLYFSPKRTLSEMYMGESGGRVYEVMVDIKNPLIIKGTKDKSLLDRIDVALGRKTAKEVRTEQRKKRSSTFTLSEERIAELKRQGYDGIMNEDANEYIAFDASQVHMVDSPQGGTQVEIVKNLKGEDGSLSQVCLILKPTLSSWTQKQA